MPRKTFALVLAAAIVWLAAPVALAHTDFEFSIPADGATLDEPVSMITIVFSGEAEPSGEGFVVLDPSGDRRAPDEVTTPDNLRWVLHFDAPIVGGTAGVRWTVAAPDAHPIEGSFSFTVTAASPNPPPIQPPSESLAGSESAALDDFLDAGASHAPLLGVFGTIARSLSLLGAMMAIGGIVFVAVVLRGRESDIRSVLFWVRRASVLLAFGAIGELTHQLATVNGNWLTIWPLSSLPQVLWSSLGLAIAMRFVGGVLMLRAHLDVVAATTTADPVLALQSAVPVGARPQTSPPGASGGEVYARAGDKAWRVDGDLGLVFAGVVITVAAFAFDGHTVTEGMRILTSLVAMTHATAGAVWAGGLGMLAHVVWRRHRQGCESRALQLAIRFSVVAAIALVVAGAAGTLLAVTVLDSVSELWLTAWGRVLIAKLALVGVAAASGAYNHKVLIPRMMRHSPQDPDPDAAFRRTIALEGVAMGLVVVLTAVLVTAAS